MKYLLQFARIIVISLAGEALHALIPLPVPASIYGIVILFTLLATGLMKLDSVKETGEFLVEIMPVMFIPAAVGIIASWDIIAPSIVAYIAVTAVSTVVVMGAAGRAAQAVMRMRRGGEGK